MVKELPQVQCFFPDYEDGKLPDREYFFRVLSTVCCEWLEAQIKTADDLRYNHVNPQKVQHVIEMSES